MNGKKTMNTVTTIIASTAASLTMATMVNDAYCYNFLKKNQYEKGSLCISYYKAKYSKIFFILSGFGGYCIGCLYSYYQKPLINVLLSN